MTKLEKSCVQGKFLNFNDEIVERRCFMDNDKVTPKDIVCGINQSLNKLKFFNGKSPLQRKHLKFESGLDETYCCHNTSHFIEYYGECTFEIYSNYSKNISKYFETPNCPIHRFRKHSRFMKYSANCLIYLSLLTECEDSSKYINCDTTLFSCKDKVY